MLFLLFPVLVHAEEDKCNPVPIKVVADPVHWANKARDEAEGLYLQATGGMAAEHRVTKLKEAILKYREAYDKIMKDRNQMAGDIIKARCPNTPILLGDPAGAGTGR